MIQSALIPIILSSTMSLAGTNNPLTVNGFLTQSVSYLDDNITYDGSVTNRVDYNYGSFAGVQFNYRYDEDIDITMQLVSQIGEQFELEMDSAHVRYAMHKNVNIKLGKIRAPVFSKSDHLNVSYAYLWTQPPIEIYTLVPFDSITGMELEWSNHLDDKRLSAQIVTGESTTTIPGSGFGGDIDSYDLINIRFSIECHNWQAYLSYANQAFEYRKRPPGYIELEQLYESNGIDTNDAFKVEQRQRGEYFGAGLDWQFGQNTIEIELGRRYVSSIFSDNTAWSVTYSRYFDEWQPYIGYNEVNDDDNQNRRLGIPEVDASLLKSLSLAQRSIVTGVRYDFRANMAAKFQWQLSESGNNDGTFYRPTDRPVNIFMLSYTSVF